MSDSDLFMECEEEELEPWQQIHENIEAERIEPFESINTVKQVTGMPAVQPVVTPVPAPAPVASTHVVLSGQTLSGSSGSSGSSKDTALPLQSLLTSMGSIPVTLPAGLKPGPGQQLIFTQGAGGLSTVALSQMLLPGHGHGTSTSQPIFFTTQGLPVQNLTAGQNPLGIVLNVQQGQTIKPITLVSAPGTSIFKQAVGGTQIINQPTPLQTVTQVGTVNHPAAPTHTTTFTRVQIPATITIRNTTPISHPKPTMVTTSSSLPSVKTTTLPANMANTSGLLTVKPGEGSTDRPKLVSLVNQPQTLILLPSQKANGLPASSTATAQLNIQASSTATSPSGLKICPRCGAQFKMIEALRGHMCAPTTSKVSAVTQAPTTSKVSPPIAPVPVQKEAEKLVMLVDDFYYGTYEGNRTNAAQDNLTNPLVFKCLTCGKKLRSNIRLMNHMKHHVELEQQNGEMDTHTSCQHCYRQFPTPFRLQCHLESVHSSYESSTKCKICEWAFETEPVFLQHMKNTHKPGEMPYVCQVCQYRSSFYSDVYNHFRTWHEDTRYLLCLYCLKTFKNSNSYQQHFSRHQKSTVYHCNKCRLQFLFTKEKLDHKLCHHKTFRKPQQLEGVSAGTKVTIRAYAINKLRSTSSGPLPGAPPPTQPKPEPAPAPVRLPQPSVPPQPMQTIQIIQQPRASASKKPISKMIELLTKFQEQRPLHGKQKCIECNYEVPDFSHHFPTYVHCSLCSYSTCCSRAYANHMITNHVARRNPKHKGYTLPPPSLLRMVCSDCDLVTFNGDMMARHLVQNPDHSYSTCTPKELLESDIEFSEVEEEEEEELRGEGTSDVGKEPDWASVDAWIGDGQSSKPIPEFTDPSGPCHTLSKHSDAIDYFQLLFPNSLMQLITYETNAFAKSQHFLGHGDSHWTPMTENELKGFFGLCIFMGLRNLPETQMYWSCQHYDGCAVFMRTMTCKRFQQIASNIRMGSWVTEWKGSSSSGKDRLRLFRPMLNILEVRMWETYKPNKNLTIDRALLPRLGTEAGNEKQREAQPRIWLLCDSKSGYCHRLHIQMRCRRGSEICHSVVPALLEGMEGKHHQFYLSKSLSSIPIMQELLGHQIYSSASVLPRSPVLPKALWDQERVETPGDFRQYTCGPVLVTRWRDVKEMFCMSTNCQPGRPDDVWRKSNSKAGELVSIKRPLAFKLLQDNMRGVDICNQLLTCNPLGGIVLDTHWRCLFCLLVNLSIINSFIVLRESRKHNPPIWVQDGRFSQAQYRKRLAYQLAKCAYRKPEPFVRTVRRRRRKRVKLLGFRIKEERESDSDQEGVRHYLCKITPKTRRCRNCTLKNARHESVFGCSACKVNLCKGHVCFWEYHGFSSQLKVSPKVGFIESREGSDMRRNRVSGSVSESLGEDSVLERNPDEEMAPLEDSESDMDQMDDPMQMSAVEYEESSRNSGQDVSQEAHTQITPTHESPKLEPQCSSREQQEEVPSARQLKTLLLTLCSGINKASEIHATKPKLIEAWLREKKEQLEHKCQRDAIDGGEAGGPVDQLVEWVLAQQEQHLPVSGENLFQKASEFHSKANQKSTFRVSHEWAVRFMLQHSLGVQAIANVGRPLPSSMEGTSQHFTDFVHQQIKQNGLCHSVIGAMDELSIFVDVDCLLDSATLEKKPTFQFVGSGKSLIDVHLTILSDGTVLPALVFFNGQLPSRLFSELPNCVLVEGKVEGFTEEEELNIWIERVWRKHLSSRSESKALLVMDGHRRHTSVSSLDNLSNCNTVPAMIPTGCSARHQPLDMCFRPVLQMFLLGRWAQLAEKGGAAGVSASDVVQLLVDWLVEALTSISDRPEVIQRSFCLAKVVDRQGEGDNNPADVQAELITTVKEAMLQTAEIETKASAEEVPGDTATTEINREQVEEEGHESQLERLPGHETDSASANKDE
ncbi:pogo transposable element derived with ZNF domain b isoform X2 [Alosa sapidissima]|uniref:pogo transposable element derived with ZNF domain b isoform X2 n=1 Tax=Alosa sapidissima TaxID=34773 RepID=UPI001C08A23B|nr:pogo transposable element derived with ZNF domain b isoform X2 [Alosa sapidissima]